MRSSYDRNVQSGVADRARRLLEERQETQADLAEALGMTCPTLSRRLNGRLSISLGMAKKMAEHFGVSVGYLLGEEG